MTWSILVRDPATGAFGAAVASRFFAVGAMCLHVEGGVAALSTQALVNPMYGVNAMPRLRTGEPAASVLASLVGPDPGAGQRQFHILDAAGGLAQHTGSDCVPWAGHVSAPWVSVAGNMLAGPQTVQATLDGWLNATGTLAERLLTAMEAGEAAGGDKRGKQSAALVIYSTEDYPDLDLRVDDHADPLAELRRLYDVSESYFSLFKRFLPTRAHPAGVYDRATIEAGIKAALAAR